MNEQCMLPRHHLPPPPSIKKKNMTFTMMAKGIFLEQNNERSSKQHFLHIIAPPTISRSSNWKKTRNDSRNSPKAMIFSLGEEK